jgi:hypothetical protein
MREEMSELTELQQIIKEKMALIVTAIFKDLFEDQRLECIHAEIINAGAYYNDENSDEFYVHNLRYSHTSEETEEYDPLGVRDQIRQRLEGNEKLFKLISPELPFSLVLTKNNSYFLTGDY